MKRRRTDDASSDASAASSASMPDAGAPAAPAASSSSAPDAVRVWTSTYKWLRAVPRDQCTGWHLDRVYMSHIELPDDVAAGAAASSLHSRSPLYSLWMPLGDLSASHGNMVVASGSHRSAQFARLREEYGRSRAGESGDKTTSGWISPAAYTADRIRWSSSPVRAGDVILLSLEVLHATTVNTSAEYRLSCDTRWTTTNAAHTPQATIRFKLQTGHKIE
jgi:ectoine hydroxylase-related dioxygenase (phytanoyl-CoA dioxygenase family)